MKKKSDVFLIVFVLIIVPYIYALQPPEELLNEDFESPTTPVAYSEGTLPDNGKWVKATGGFGAGRVGINDKAGGDFTAPDPNHQVFAFRYTNSGVTSYEGAIALMVLGTTYTVSFDVVMDIDKTPYMAQFIAFTNGAARNDCRSTPAGSTILASQNGNALGDGSFTNITFQFTPDPVDDIADIGKDLGVRFIGASSSASIDNVIVTWIPPDPAGTVFTIM